MKFLKKLFPKRRSVVFYRQSYYHFYYLAQALRKRGWDAVVVNLEPVDGANANFYHGEDINLYDSNPVIFQQNINHFFQYAQARFQLMHFAGDGYLSFYPEYAFIEEPPDILAWKKLHKKIAYSISGCNSGTSQTMVSQWSIADNGLNVCDRCVWQDHTEVCANEKNLDWGAKVHKYCDLIFSETLPALDYMKPGNKVIREPTTMCLDPDFWSPDLHIPDEHRVKKETGEVLIYHAVGNYNFRNTQTKNIKGTPFVFAAVERLQEEGYPVRLIFITDQPNQVVRYYQAQSDIIVDQLNYGRYGANAREGMMLGKPVICYLNKYEFREEDKLACLAECPLVSASEKTIYDELKNLVVNAALRKTIGAQSRQYALKWHAADACAERYERIYDQLFS
ncbi:MULTISPECIES: glycosyltransferase [Legionella]|uniref:Glycosyltransferase family 1 protein n=1 Tax=Legionella septentrionalis TaxID=2498109 RepID=A0A3S0VAX2_9GAMM|nr:MULTISPECIES: hypothetical protein [Legionella]MCP0914350.1 hypothetical protein [Legionella sp. 27cVA30]RUQ88990.1 hypothetical protein EKM59_04120 [Legionella septentrionalis]RUR00297.1 hypothetical protein ELY11_02825 [Legionella septentrionalis]RUR17533.1 hypothetical protein ELY10_00965 [Legionella septentrionalis]